MASRVFAVDLGAWSVKLVMASPGLRGASLTHVIERLVPPGDDAPETRAKAVLAGLVDELRLRDDAGYLGVYGDQVFTQVLEFGFKSLRRTELDKAVGGELEGVVPLDLEDMVYAFEPIPAVAPVPMDDMRGRIAAPAEGMRVLTYAMRRERAEALIQLGTDCGFEARGILACGGAAAKLVDRTPSLVKARAEGAVAVIDVGHERTDVVVVQAGKAVFSRSIARAGKQVTEAIRRQWKLAWEDAERAKHSDGFVASNNEPATSDAWAKIHEALIGELQPFARDLRQTLAACRARTGLLPMAAILIGGGSRLRGLASFLTEQLALPTWKLTADDMAALAGPKIGAQAAASLPIDSAAMTVGMAYEGASGRPSFDLRSGALAVRVDLSFLRAKAVPLAAAALTVAAFAGISAYADLYALKKSEKTLNTRLATESAEVFNGEPRTAEQILGENDPTTAAGGNGSPIPKMTAYDLMLEVSNHMPARDKVTLDVDKVEIDELHVSIEGLAKAPDSKDATAVAAAVDNIYGELKRLDCLKDPQRGDTTTEGDGKRFRVTFNNTCTGTAQ